MKNPDQPPIPNSPEYNRAWGSGELQQTLISMLGDPHLENGQTNVMSDIGRIIAVITVSDAGETNNNGNSN